MSAVNNDSKGVDCNLIALAWSVQCLPIIMDTPEQEEESSSEENSNQDDTPLARHQNATVVPITLQLHGWMTIEKSSDCLNNNDWVERIKKIVGSSETSFLEVDDDMKKQADLLQEQLLHRLICHVECQVKEKKNCRHWCLN